MREGLKGWDMRSEREKKEFSRIVSRKAQAMYHPHSQTIRDIVYWLKVWQPTARDIRSEGRCPHCKQPKLCSYITIEFYHPRTNGSENCGYYCGWCGWGNAGSRYQVDSIDRVIVRRK